MHPVLVPRAGFFALLSSLKACSQLASFPTGCSATVTAVITNRAGRRSFSEEPPPSPLFSVSSRGSSNPTRSAVIRGHHTLLYTRVLHRPLRSERDPPERVTQAASGFHGFGFPTRLEISATSLVPNALQRFQVHFQNGLYFLSLPILFLRSPSPRRIDSSSLTNDWPVFSAGRAVTDEAVGFQLKSKNDNADRLLLQRFRLFSGSYIVVSLGSSLIGEGWSVGNAQLLACSHASRGHHYGLSRTHREGHIGIA